MRLQRVRGAESRVEMQTDKWTIEGVVKSSSLIESLRVFCNVTPALRARDVMASCKRALGIAKQGGTAGISILWPVLDVFEDGSFYLSSLPPL